MIAGSALRLMAVRDRARKEKESLRGLYRRTPEPVCFGAKMARITDSGALPQ